MRTFLRPLMLCALFCAACGIARPAFGHGFVGNRFFPPTVATDDPFAVDELALPSFSFLKTAAADGNPATYEFDSAFEFDKEIFPHFAMGISDTYIIQKSRGMHSQTGFADITLTAKYQVWQNDEHEAIFSIGLEADIGGTGSKNFADPFTTYTPKIYLGKGFGDLPDSVNYLQPFAVTGEFGQSFPTSARAPNTFSWGFAVEYSLPYLQQHVRDIGLPAPFKDMIPLVEFSLETTENRGVGGLTTGTINPGVLWVTPYYELAAEANIPINHQSGSNVGVTVQLWIFIDDIFPRTFGHPLFGE